MPTTDNYIASGNISVFPCGNRHGLYTLSRLNTEYNLVSVINRLVDMKSFCVTSSVSDDGDFLFNVGGYLFTVKVDDLKKKINSNNYKYLYAGICVGKRYGSALLELLPLLKSDSDTNVNMDTDDADNKFVGVVFIPYNNLIEPGELGEGWTSSTSINYTDIFNSIVPTVTIDRVLKYILPILYKDTSGSLSVPPVSLVKMATTKEGERRSVTIDDGELS